MLGIPYIIDANLPNVKTILAGENIYTFGSTLSLHVDDENKAVKLSYMGVNRFGQSEEHRIEFEFIDGTYVPVEMHATNITTPQAVVPIYDVGRNTMYSLYPLPSVMQQPLMLIIRELNGLKLTFDHQAAEKGRARRMDWQHSPASGLNRQSFQYK